MPRGNIEYSAAGIPAIAAPSLQENEQVCADEPFAKQPSAATCTAVLIDDDLLATAGHCFTTAWDCQNYLFVFGYAYATESQPLELGPLEVYECRRARVQENDLVASHLIRDYAIIELTQRVRGRVPLALRKAPPLEHEALNVVSATQGVPLKVDTSARVLDTRSAAGDYFLLRSETFRGSSGAPVLDRDGQLLGLFVRGNEDYWWDAGVGCYRAMISPRPDIHGPNRDKSALGARHPASAAMRAEPHVFSDAGTHFEQATYAVAAVNALCQSGYSSVRLCSDTPSGATASCSPTETNTSCH